MRKKWIVVAVLVGTALLAVLLWIVQFGFRHYQIGELSEQVLYGELVVDDQVEYIEIELTGMSSGKKKGEYRFEGRDEISSVMNNVLDNHRPGAWGEMPSYSIDIFLIDGRHLSYFAYFHEGFDEPVIQVSARPITAVSLGHEGALWLKENCVDQ